MEVKYFSFQLVDFRYFDIQDVGKAVKLCVSVCFVKIFIIWNVGGVTKGKYT